MGLIALLPPDAQVLLAVLTAMALLFGGTATVLLLSAPEDRQWRGVHRAGAPAYTPSHGPGRGMWRAPYMDRLDEGTVSVDPSVLLRGAGGVHEHRPYRDGVRLRCSTCRLDLPRPDGVDISRHGFSSW